MRFELAKDDSDIESKHCSSLRISVKLSRKSLLLNWLNEHIVPCWLDSLIGWAAVRKPEDARLNPAQVNFSSWLEQCRLIMKFALHITLRVIAWRINENKRLQIVGSLVAVTLLVAVFPSFATLETNITEPNFLAGKQVSVFLEIFSPTWKRNSTLCPCFAFWQIQKTLW